MTDGYFNYLSHFVGGVLLSYSYFIFRLIAGQPQNLARGNFAVRTDCVTTPLQSTAIVSCNVVLNDVSISAHLFDTQLESWISESTCRPDKQMTRRLD
jgi:hypothetical protein